jgi:SAM-dependent methyltransferase
MDFSHFDSRNYPTISVKKGYGEWVTTYEQSVEDEMDIRLLARIGTVRWEAVQQAIDLACGTGRTGSWLHGKGTPIIDGVDLTAEMLRAARKRNIYRQLVQADVTRVPLPAAAYDLSIMALADEHLPDISPLYAEAARLTTPGGHFAIVGYHPHFLMKGLITHFHRADGEPVGIESYVHLLSDHVKAAHRAGWLLVEMDEGIIDQSWLEKKPHWKPYLHHPVSFSMVWHKPG